MISIPPFQVIGRIHLLPERDLREALVRADRPVLPVTDATYWSDSVGEARQSAPMVAINHQRAQILAPHREVDPWAGLDRAGETAARRSRRRAAIRPPAATERGPGRRPSTGDPSSATWPRGCASALAVDRQVQPVAPLGPAAVVDRDVVVAEEREHEGELRRGDARAVVADHPPAAGDVRLRAGCRAARRRP